MKRSQILCFALLLLCVLLLFCGCGGTRQTTEQLYAPSSQELELPATAAPEETSTEASAGMPGATALPITSFSSEDTVIGNEVIKPYIMFGQTDNSIRIRWAGNHSYRQLIVVYGRSIADIVEGRGAVATAQASPVIENWLFPTSYVYEARLAVEPGTDYVYGICHVKSMPETFYSFRTPGESHVTAVFVSDTHLVNDYDFNALKTTLSSSLSYALKYNGGLDLICHLGDLTDNISVSPYLFVGQSDMLRSIPITAICGNHDNRFSVYSWFPMDYMDVDLQDYWFIQGDVLFIGLNGADENYYLHADYLRKALTEAGRHKWTVVMLHYSMRSNGQHGQDQQPLNFRYVLEPIMTELDVDLVISGHDHEYNRSVLVDADGMVECEDDNLIVKSPGQLLYLTIPSGTGIKYYEESRETEYPMVTEGMEREPGYVLAEFSEDQMLLTVCRSSDGAVVDKVTLRHRTRAQ